ncbi:MAG: exodeoxyribonuclease VII small subunit [Clostridia bacterium]|nr:exodeoxyribonuclease VII small subunit [Clostridia bacterium]
MSDKNLTFEEAYEALERITERLAQGDITLDESIKLYEEGVRLSKYCADMIEAARQKIETLRGNES